MNSSSYVCHCEIIFYYCSFLLIIFPFSSDCMCVCVCVCVYMYIYIWLPRWLCGKDPPANAADTGQCTFNPCGGKISGRRKWQPYSVSLPGWSHGQRSLVGYGRIGSQTVRHNWLSIYSHTYMRISPAPAPHIIYIKCGFSVHALCHIFQNKSQFVLFLYFISLKQMKIY